MTFDPESAAVGASAFWLVQAGLRFWHRRRADRALAAILERAKAPTEWCPNIIDVPPRTIPALHLPCCLPVGHEGNCRPGPLVGDDDIPPGAGET